MNTVKRIGLYWAPALYHNPSFAPQAARHKAIKLQAAFTTFVQADDSERLGWKFSAGCDAEHVQGLSSEALQEALMGRGTYGIAFNHWIRDTRRIEMSFYPAVTFAGRFFFRVQFHRKGEGAKDGTNREIVIQIRSDGSETVNHLSERQ